MAPSGLLLVECVYPTLFWRKTACPCGFAVEPTSCLCFSQLWNATKSNRVGRWLLPGKKAMSLSTMVEEAIVSPHQELCRVCFIWEMHTHSDNINRHKHTNMHGHVHTCSCTYTHSPVNPQKCSICSSFSSRGYTQTTDGWAISECCKASSQIPTYPTKVTKQKAGICVVSGLWLQLEILKCMLLSLENMNEVLWYKHLTPCVHTDKVHSQIDILDSSCDKQDGLSHFCY